MKLFQILYIYHSLSLSIRVIYTFFSPSLPSLELFHTSLQKTTFETFFLSGQFKSDSSRSHLFPLFPAKARWPPALITSQQCFVSLGYSITADSIINNWPSHFKNILRYIRWDIFYGILGILEMCLLIREQLAWEANVD